MSEEESSKKPMADEGGDQTPTMSEKPALPPWNCRVQKWDDDSAVELEKLYVGDKFLLRCEGPFVDNVSPKLTLKPIHDASAYAISVLEFRTVENNGVWASVTSYKPGKHTLSSFQLVDGEIVIPLQGGELQVQSVLANLPPEQKANPEAMKMKMIGPFILSMPWWYWAAWFLAFAVVFSLIGRWLQKKLQRKKILENLARQATALTPYNQFNKEVREQMRKYTSTVEGQGLGPVYMKDLDVSFRMYLLRELLVPANEWGTGAVMRDIKTRHKKIYKNLGPRVRRTLVEFDRAQKDPNAVTFEDCEQMRDMSRRAVDGVFKMKRLLR